LIVCSRSECTVCFSRYLDVSCGYCFAALGYQFCVQYTLWCSTIVTLLQLDNWLISDCMAEPSVSVAFDTDLVATLVVNYAVADVEWFEAGIYYSELTGI
jgi:hypothetical protein